MHSQTDHANRPMRAGHAEKMASRVGSGGNARSGESPDASTFYPKGGMCVSCAHRARDCSHLDFAAMYPIKRNNDNTTAVRCDEFSRAV